MLKQATLLIGLVLLGLSIYHFSQNEVNDTEIVNSSLDYTFYVFERELPAPICKDW